MSLQDLPEEIIERHRQEKKDLNAKITKLRFSVPKNDKKKKKEINNQIDLMESELKAKHEQELNEWYESNQNQQQQQSNDTNNHDNNNINDDDDNIDEQQPQKLTKSQRRRENKERKDRERQERIRAGLLDDIDSTRSIEMKKIESLLEERNLSLCEIPSDGDCMYKAIEHQLRLTRNIEQTVDELRLSASEYIRQNKNDFLPFLLNDENTNLVNDNEFDVYCDKIANTKTWGGHLELKALSNRLKVPIEIIQAEGTPIRIGFNEFGSRNPLILCYFRHAYRLGEHYNSVMPNGDIPDDEEWHNTE